MIDRDTLPDREPAWRAILEQAMSPIALDWIWRQIERKGLAERPGLVAAYERRKAAIESGEAA